MTQPPDLVYVKSLLAPFKVLTSNSTRVKIKKFLPVLFTWKFNLHIHLWLLISNSLFYSSQP